MQMKSRVALFVVALLFSATEIKTQESSAVRPRVVTTATQDQQVPVQPALPQAKPPDLAPSLPLALPEIQKKTTEPLGHLTPSLIQARITEARRMLKTRPMATAMSVPSIQFVTIAALDREASRTHLITISKESFLTKGTEISTISSLGTNVNVKVLRANGVNTSLTIFTAGGQSLVPLTV